MRSYSPKDIVAVRLEHGFEFLRGSGSHQIFINRLTGKRTVVPMHSKDLKKGTLHGILKQAGINPEELN